MTAAALLTRAIAQRLRGACTLRPDGTILARDASRHADCSTCHAPCDRQQDLGMADAGVSITQDSEGMRLEWACPSCATTVTERTSILTTHADAARVTADPLCHRCRK